MTENLATVEKEAEKLTTASDLARVLRLNKYFIYQEAAKGNLPHYRCGGAVRFSIKEVKAWMQRQAAGGKRNPRP